MRTQFPFLHQSEQILQGLHLRTVVGSQKGPAGPGGGAVPHGCPWGLKDLTQRLRANGASSEGTCVHGLTSPLQLLFPSEPRWPLGCHHALMPHLLCFVQTPILGYRNRFAASFLKCIQTRQAETCLAAFCWTWTMIQKAPPCEAPRPRTPHPCECSRAGRPNSERLSVEGRESPTVEGLASSQPSDSGG